MYKTKTYYKIKNAITKHVPLNDTIIDNIATELVRTGIGNKEDEVTIILSSLKATMIKKGKIDDEYLDFLIKDSIHSKENKEHIKRQMENAKRRANDQARTTN